MTQWRVRRKQQKNTFLKFIEWYESFSSLAPSRAMCDSILSARVKFLLLSCSFSFVSLSLSLSINILLINTLSVCWTAICTDYQRAVVSLWWNEKLDKDDTIATLLLEWLSSRGSWWKCEIRGEAEGERENVRGDSWRKQTHEAVCVTE